MAAALVAAIVVLYSNPSFGWKALDVVATGGLVLASGVLAWTLYRYFRHGVDPAERMRQIEDEVRGKDGSTSTRGD